MALQTPSQIPVTTAPFAGGGIPGLDAGQVPGIPSPAAATAPQTPDPNDKVKQIIALIQQAAQRKQVANTAVPMALPEGGDVEAARNIGMNTAWPSAWSTQRFLGTLGASIKNGVRAQKEKQLLSAEGDWTYLQAALNEKFQADQSGDPQAIAQAQKKVDAITGDPKKLKNMAKALNQDWLNPEKTTVYGEALKNVTQKQQQADAQNKQKQGAAEGLKRMFQHLIQKSQNPQLTDEQKLAIAREVQAKAPTTTAGLDKTTAAALLEQQKEEGRAAAEAKKEEARAKEAEEKAAWQREELELKEKFTRQRDQIQNQFHQTMETMREQSAEQRQNAHDMKMMEMLGMRLDAQQAKLFKPDPNKLNKEITDSVTSLRQQLAQANQQLKSLRTSHNQHSAVGRLIGLGASSDEIKDAEDSVKSLQKAVEHIEKNRDAIINGKADLGDVMDKAYAIMGGGESNSSSNALSDVAPPPPPVPGAVVKQVP